MVEVSFLNGNFVHSVRIVIRVLSTNDKLASRWCPFYWLIKLWRKNVKYSKFNSFPDRGSDKITNRSNDSPFRHVVFPLQKTELDFCNTHRCSPQAQVWRFYSNLLAILPPNLSSVIQLFYKKSFNCYSEKWKNRGTKNVETINRKTSIPFLISLQHAELIAHLVCLVNFLLIGWSASNWKLFVISRKTTTQDGFAWRHFSSSSRPPS